MLTRFCITDISTAPIDGCADWLDEPQAPSNWKDPAKIAAYIAEKKADQTERAGLDPDLGRITGIGVWQSGYPSPEIWLCRSETDERNALDIFAEAHKSLALELIGFNSLKFDWPFLMRRAAYLGVKLSINVDKYRGNNLDLSDILTHHGALTARSLGFYQRRLKMGLTKPLSGAEESQVPVSGRWPELELSLRHDVEATRRLAVWMGLIAPVTTPESEPAF